MTILLKVATSFEKDVSNLITHGTTRPKKPVSRLRAGVRSGLVGAIGGAAQGYISSQALNIAADSLAGKGPKISLVTPQHKIFTALGGAIGGARGFHRGMRGLGPARGARVRVHGLNSSYDR